MIIITLSWCVCVCFVGLIVAELKNGKDLNREDRDILCESQIKFSAAYILSLGVVNAKR